MISWLMTGGTITIPPFFDSLANNQYNPGKGNRLVSVKLFLPTTDAQYYS
jgi:hypothetical protein